jgi:hypothetical protein
MFKQAQLEFAVGVIIGAALIGGTLAAREKPSRPDTFAALNVWRYPGASTDLCFIRFETEPIGAVSGPGSSPQCRKSGTWSAISASPYPVVVRFYEARVGIQAAGSLGLAPGDAAHARADRRDPLQIYRAVSVHLGGICA